MTRKAGNRLMSVERGHPGRQCCAQNTELGCVLDVLGLILAQN
jgi:hypothetical protein